MPRALAWAWTLALLAACLAPGRATRRLEPDRPGVGTLADKAAHLAMFAGFGFLWTRAGTAGRAAAFGAALAVGTELLQGVPAIGRDPDVLDALADLAGLLVGVAIPPRRRPPGDGAPVRACRRAGSSRRGGRA